VDNKHYQNYTLINLK